MQFITTINGFYKEKELLEAKALLFNTVKKMNITDDVLRMRKLQGEAKYRTDVEDIIGTFDFLDTKQLQLPVEFVAKNLQRIPVLTPSDVDVFKLTENVVLDRADKRYAAGHQHGGTDAEYSGCSQYLRLPGCYTIVD